MVQGNRATSPRHRLTTQPQGAETKDPEWKIRHPAGGSHAPPPAVPPPEPRINNPNHPRRIRAQTEGRRLWRHMGTADVLGRRVLKDPVDNAGPVEPTQHREPPGHSRGLQPPDLLHPTQVELHMHSSCLKRCQVMLEAPEEVGVQVRGRVRSRLALVASQVRGNSKTQDLVSKRVDYCNEIRAIHPTRHPPKRSAVNAARVDASGTSGTWGTKASPNSPRSTCCHLDP